MFCGQNRPCPQSLEEESADHEHDEPAMVQGRRAPCFFIVYRGKGKPCSTLAKWIRLIEFILSKNNLPTPTPLNRL